uniref:Uncharacterized protein n=1 Tax=Glossina pallidipes TaxID=7398 RepID=A0A1A9Z603_GLOPL
MIFIGILLGFFLLQNLFLTVISCGKTPQHLLSMLETDKVLKSQSPMVRNFSDKREKLNFGMNFRQKSFSDDEQVFLCPEIIIGTSIQAIHLQNVRRAGKVCVCSQLQKYTHNKLFPNIRKVA